MTTEFVGGSAFTDEEVRFTVPPMVYLAGPFAHPDVVLNTHEMIHAADRLNGTGLVVCYVPHLHLIQHLVIPAPDDHWYALDLAFLSRCDALLRLPGESTGADREVEFADEQGDIHVFDSEVDLLAWAGEWDPEQEVGMGDG